MINSARPTVRRWQLFLPPSPSSSSGASRLWTQRTAILHSGIRLFGFGAAVSAPGFCHRRYRFSDKEGFALVDDSTEIDSMSSILNIIPALAFLLILSSISAYIQRTSRKTDKKGFRQGLLHRQPYSRRLCAGYDHRCHLQQRKHLRRRSGVAWVIGYGWPFA